MKFMKLGSKPDAFLADGKTIRYISAELATDIVISVGEVKFYLHKFPLLSKSYRMQKLVLKAKEENSEEINLADFPGGPKAFEICAKFCYGMTVTLNAYNVVAARCAAEYLEMTEDVDRGNLIFKIEVFLNSSIFRSWKDSIIVLQTTRSLLPWSDDLKIVGRCVDSIASRTSIDPANVDWSYTHNRKLASADRVLEEGIKFQERMESVPKDWWIEDLCELDIDLFKRVIVAVKSKGRMDANVIGEALRTYAVRWLPDSVDALVSDANQCRNKSLLENLIALLPSDVNSGSCSFLLKLLKVATLVGSDGSAREQLVERVGLKLHEASVIDLLIPSQAPKSMKYDVELVKCLLKQYLLHGNYGRDRGIKNNEVGNGIILLELDSLLNVGKLIDGYLVEIAHDPNLPLLSFIELSQSIPDSGRPIHDTLYRAIDAYLKEHPSLTKSERKRICGLMDIKKLTMEASIDAAQNERLPLRVVVQVLYFEQVRGAQALGNTARDTSCSTTTNTDEESEKMTVESCRKLEKQIGRIKIEDGESKKSGKLAKKSSSRNSRSGGQLLPSRSRRIFDKLWSVGKGHRQQKSSETSGSSQSPTSLVPVDTKSSGSSTRHRRYSIS
ncbi:BTB/POZ domain-containing protein NPY1 [Rhodamnia argentea]|uniref:BTB/POZ domain-containing protein NPY1 n=1 Tax=Rhodamnia argentea TaxID=178133 RepID=A0A8B8QUN1_9MYRT|nr:BTB/POZ domain-containing protein NPY1 [Rhodamnia argentea]